MSEKRNRFINNEEYCSLFRRKSYRSAFIITGVSAAVIFIMIIIGRNTNALCNTNFFHIISDKSVIVNTSYGDYIGEEYLINIKSAVLEDNILSICCDMIGSSGKPELSPTNIYVAKYSSDGSASESISYPSAGSSFTVSKDNENVINAQLDFTIDNIYGNYSDYIFCLRLDTDSSDGMINILLDINI